MSSRCTYCGTINEGSGYKGECPSCPPNAMSDMLGRKKRTCKCGRPQPRWNGAKFCPWCGGEIKEVV